jgi:hypothetical protein
MDAKTKVTLLAAKAMIAAVTLAASTMFASAESVTWLGGTWWRISDGECGVNQVAPAHTYEKMLDQGYDPSLDSDGHLLSLTWIDSKTNKKIGFYYFRTRESCLQRLAQAQRK